MTTISLRQRSSLRSGVAVLAACLALSGCVGLPKPDGVEAAIIARAATLPALKPAEGREIKSVARNGLLLSPAVREAASSISASADEVRVQRAALFPGLSLSMGGGVGEAGSGQPSLALTGSQLLFDGGNTKRAIKLADFDLQINYIAFQKTVDETLQELLKAYDNVHTQSELLDVYRKQRKALGELEVLVAERARNGAVSSTDHLETRKRLQSAEFLVHDTELALAEAQDKLLLLTGQAEGGRIKITAQSCAAVDSTDRLRMAQLSLARAQVALERAEREAVSPRITLKPVVTGELGVNKLPVGLNVDVQSDLLQGGALTAKANIARNNLSGTEAKLDVIQLEDNLGERALLRSIAAGERKVELLQREISLLKETRELYRSQYFDMGTRQLSELLDNEQEYYSRQAELVQLRAEMVSHQISCAIRSRTLRQELDLEGTSLYGFPLAADLI